MFKLTEENPHSIQQKQQQRYKSTCSIIAAVLCFNLGSFFFGYSMVYFNSIDYDVIEEIFQITMESGKGEGLLSGSVAFGAFFGAFASTKILKTFSRKHSFYFTNALAFVSIVIILFRLEWSLFLGRIMQGFCVGTYSSIVPVMVKEYSPLALNGPLGAIQNIMIACGFLLGFIVPYLFSLGFKPETYWFYAFGFPLLTVGVHQILLMTIFTSETPKYLLTKGRNDEAKELIAMIYKEEYQDIIYHEKLADLNADNENDEGKQKQYPPDNPKAIFLSFSLQAFQQLSGINIIVLYGGELAEGFLPSLKTYLPMLINGEKLLVSIVGSLLLVKFGRRSMLLNGLFILVLSLFGLFIGFQFHQTHPDWTNPLIMVSFFTYIISFVITLGPIVWLYIPEVVQPNIVPYTTMTNWFCACLIITLFPVIRQNSKNKDCPFLFLVFSLCTLVKFFICYKLMVETKGKTETQIRSQFQMINIT